MLAEDDPVVPVIEISPADLTVALEDAGSTIVVESMPVDSEMSHPWIAFSQP